MMAPLKKWKISNRPGSFKRRKRAGMILVVTLAIIVLVTIAVLAFFSHALLNRQVESSRTNRAKAGLLAYTGQDYVTGLFLGEIAANSVPSATNGVTLYFPKSSTNSMAMRMVGPNVSTSDTNFFNLIRQSAPAADANASTHSTAEAARNGRLITTDRWNAPRLLPGQGFSQTNQLPCWIYVTRSGGITNTPSNDVIGRFAYNVYDLGGLLDVSAAGYPSVSTNISSLKGTAAGADLMQLPGLTQSAVDSLLAFRNPGAVSDASTYAEAVTAFEGDGFLSASATNSRTGRVFTNNAFLNRQDLLRYARTQNNALTNALPYLTQFSRSLNAPSWTPPSTPANSNPRIPDVRVSTGGSVTHYHDNGTVETYPVNAGQPLVQQRFSFGKLAWLTPTGPASGISDGAIQVCFGLQWNDGKERWDYVGPSGNVPQSGIKALDEIAAEAGPREPNFFELLKAGILDATLGGHALGKTSTDANQYAMSACAEPGNSSLDANKDLHVLQIGANIIDCADADNYPTVVALTFGGVVVEKAGVEDLPYFYALDVANIRVMTALTPAEKITFPGKTHRLDSCDFVWVPELFNPHGNTSSASGPASIQIDIASGILIQLGFGANTSFSPTVSATPNKVLSGLPPIVVPSSDWAAFRDAPRPARNASAPNSLGKTVPAADAAIGDVLAFHIFSYSDPADQSPTLCPVNCQADSKMAGAQVTDLIVRLRYLTPKGNLKTYSTLGGCESFPSGSGINGFKKMDFTFPVIKHSDTLASLQTNTSFKSVYLIAWDPRSSRFGPGFAGYDRTVGDPPLFNMAGNKDTVYGRPCPFWEPINQTMYLWSTTTGGLPANSFAGTLPQMPAFQDADATARMPDAGLGYNKASPSTPTAANPYGNLSNRSLRPVILQRPYQTVAELGYVFRDMPWQTLDYFNGQGGDAALLDLFSVADEPRVTAGRTGLNTLHASVRAALLSQTAQLSTGASPLANATNVAAVYNSYAFSTGLPSTNVPQNVADLAGFMGSANISGAGLDTIKYHREAVVRALGGSQARTWNLLIDLIAQSGRFSGSASSGNFVVQGENRSWTSVAIDRYTGKIVDRTIENLNE